MNRCRALREQEDGLDPIGSVGIEAIVARMVGDQPTSRDRSRRRSVFGCPAHRSTERFAGALAAVADDESDAGAGERAAGLARLHQQRVSRHGCQTGPDDVLGRELDQAGVRCAEVTVPLDYARPGDRMIRVAISRLKATDTAHRRGVLLVNPGGPGAPALDFPLTVSAVMGEVAGRYDLIGFDHRFVGRSAPIDCGPITLATALGSAGKDRAGFEQSVRTSAEPDDQDNNDEDDLEAIDLHEHNSAH